MYKWVDIFSKRMLSFIPLYRRHTEAQRDCHILKTTLLVGGRVNFKSYILASETMLRSPAPETPTLAVACGSGLVCWCHSCPSSVASVTNYHKLSGLIQPVISPAVWRPGVWNGFMACAPFGGSRGGAASLPFLSPRGHLHFTSPGSLLHLQNIEAPSPSSSTFLCLCLHITFSLHLWPPCLLLLRTLAMNDSVADVINWGYSSLSQDPELNHIC